MTEPSTPPARPAHPAHAERKFLVLVAMFLAGCLFVGTAGLLYYRWWTSTEPSTAVIVTAGENLRGAEGTVEGLGLSKPHRAILGERERFALPFFLDPGIYTVRLKK